MSLENSVNTEASAYIRSSQVAGTAYITRTISWQALEPFFPEAR
jgi:hypothetical protein